MSTPIDKLKQLAGHGWSKDTTAAMKDVLKAAEVSYLLPFEGYVSDLAPIRFLLHYSDFEEPMVRLLWHRYTEMKLKVPNVEATLKRASEFIHLLTDLSYEAISQMMDKQLQTFTPDLAAVAKVIRHNYRVNLWQRVAQSYEDISQKELLAIFAVGSLETLAEHGFKFAVQGDYVRLEPLSRANETQKECEMQMRILEKAISRIESMKA